jgi:hypothetical protein
MTKVTTSAGALGAPWIYRSWSRSGCQSESWSETRAKSGSWFTSEFWSTPGTHRPLSTCVSRSWSRSRMRYSDSFTDVRERSIQP